MRRADEHGVAVVHLARHAHSVYGTFTTAVVVALVLAACVGVSVKRYRRIEGYTKISPWKRTLLYERSPWTLFGRSLRASADREQAEAERMALFAATQTALAQQHGAADPAARFGLAGLPDPSRTTTAPAGGFPPPTDATPFPPPRPMRSAPTADDVLPHG